MNIQELLAGFTDPDVEAILEVGDQRFKFTFIRGRGEMVCAGEGVEFHDSIFSLVEKKGDI